MELPVSPDSCDHLLPPEDVIRAAYAGLDDNVKPHDENAFRREGVKATLRWILRNRKILRKWLNQGKEDTLLLSDEAHTQLNQDRKEQGLHTVPRRVIVSCRDGVHVRVLRLSSQATIASMPSHALEKYDQRVSRRPE